MENSLVYIRGGVPGKHGTCVQIRDAIKKSEFNAEFLNYPTFVGGKGS